jgi:hypothetical protein
MEDEVVGETEETARSAVNEVSWPTLRLLLTSRPTEVSRPLVEGHLYESVAAVAEDGTLTPLTRSEMTGTPDQLLEAVSARVRRVSAPADLLPVDTLPGLFVLVSDDGLAASRMRVVPDLVRPSPLGGLVVAVPGPDQLMCVPMHSAGSIDALQILASALGHAATHRPFVLSDQLFWFDGELWIPVPVQYGAEDITVLPPAAFVATVNRLAAMDLVQLAGEA